MIIVPLNEIKMKYYWQGESVKIKFILAQVAPDLKNPIYWFNYECALSENSTAKIPCVQVFYRDEPFIIANHFGIGVHKMINGGWPNFPHHSIGDNEPFEPDENPILVFDKMGYKRHEESRDEWREKNYPAEYKRLSFLKSLLKK